MCVEGAAVAGFRMAGGGGGSGKKTKLAKGRLDKFYHLAKEQGLRSRAAFKLIQLNRKYDFLSRARGCVDLCAAPGSWMQVAVKYMPMDSVIIGVDLAPIKPLRGCYAFQEDITSGRCRTVIREKLGKQGAVDVVLHDGAPNVGGSWAKEAYEQNVLALQALALACEFLAPNGTFVTKVFRSQDYTSLLYALSQLFGKVEATKPTASRNTSAEIFVVCLHYKAPKRVDPRLLDPKHVFEQVREEARSGSGWNALGESEAGKKVRQREGYDDDVTARGTMHRPRGVVEFITTSRPTDVLGECTELSFRPPGRGGAERGRADDGGEFSVLETPASIAREAEVYKSVADHPETSEEIEVLCADIRLLGKRDFKTLMAWRLSMRKFLGLEVKRGGAAAGGAGEGAAAVGEVEEEEEEVDEELEDLQKIAEMKEILDSKRKAEKRKAAKEKEKVKMRLASMAMDGNASLTKEQRAEAAKEGIERDTALFSLDKFKTTGDALGDDALKDLKSRKSATKQALDDFYMSASEGEDDEDGGGEAALLERQLDTLYDSFVERKGVAAKRALSKTLDEGRRGRKRSKADLEEVEVRPLDVRKRDREDSDISDSSSESGVGEDSDADVGSDELDSDAEEMARNARRNAEAEDGEDDELDDKARAHLFFKSTAFADLGADDSDEEEEERRPAKRGRVPSAEAGPFNEKKAAKKAAQREKKVAKAQGGEKAKDGVVDVQVDSDSEYDTDDKAEIVAWARKLQSKKELYAAYDSGFNRYSYPEAQEELPRWFAAEEARHNRPNKPITKAEVLAEKERMKLLGSRTTKREMEGAARTRKKLTALKAKVHSQASKIADSTEMSERAKAKQIERLYKAKGQLKRPGKVYMVNSGAGKAGHKAQRADPNAHRTGKTRTKLVDKRMLADKRAAKARANRKGSGKGKSGGKKSGGKHSRR